MTSSDSTNPAPMVTVGELVARFLEQCGVRIAFGVICSLLAVFEG